jgi:hypothetical protein
MGHRPQNPTRMGGQHLHPAQVLSHIPLPAGIGGLDGFHMFQKIYFFFPPFGHTCLEADRGFARGKHRTIPSVSAFVDIAKTASPSSPASCVQPEQEVFRDMTGYLSHQPGASDPLKLNKSDPDLRLLFQAMYSNDPHRLITAGNVVHLCGMAHNYAATDLESASFQRTGSFLCHCFRQSWSVAQPSMLCGMQPPVSSVLPQDEQQR